MGRGKEEPLKRLACDRQKSQRRSNQYKEAPHDHVTRATRDTPRIMETVCKQRVLDNAKGSHPQQHKEHLALHGKARELVTHPSLAFFNRLRSVCRFGNLGSCLRAGHRPVFQ